MNANAIPLNLIKEISEALGAAYYDPNGIITLRADGASIHIAYLWKDHGKLDITCRWPRDKNGGYYCPSLYAEKEKNTTQSIKCSAKKTPAKIAAEIKRRLLPDFLPLWEAKKKEADAHDLYAEKTLQSAEHMACELGLNFQSPKTHHNPSLYVDSPSEKNGFWGTAAFSGETVQLDLRSVPVDDAIEVIKMLRARRDGRAGQ